MDGNPEKQRADAHRESANIDTGTTGPPRTLDIPHPIADTSKSQKQGTHRFNWREWRAWANLGVAVLTLIAVIWYATIARNQWRETIRSNTLTEQALLETKRSNELTQRAWVIARGVSVVLLREPEPNAPAKVRQLPPWALKITIDNIGHSPGTITAYQIAFLRTHPQTCPQLGIEGRKQLAMFSVPEKEGYFTAAGSLITLLLDQALHDSRAGREFSVHGIIYYTDIFKKVNWTRFCFFLLPHIDASNALLPKESRESTFGVCQMCNSWSE